MKKKKGKKRENTVLGTGRMTQCFPKDLRSVTNTHIPWLVAATHNSSSGGFSTLSGPLAPNPHCNVHANRKLKLNILG